MLSYYNPTSSEWEPFIEKAKVELMTNNFKGQIFNLISFKNDLNINLTTEFIHTLIQTYNQLKKNIEKTQ